MALSKGGIDPIDMFRSLSEREDEYGEIAVEARAVVRNVEYLGYGPIEALTDVAETTPSQKFREFLEPFVSVVETGSNMTQFLTEKSGQYYEEIEKEQTRALDKLALYAELYVIGFGLGPFLAVMVWIPMSMIGNFPIFPVQAIIYLVIPFGSIVFAILIDRISRPVPEKEYARPQGEKTVSGIKGMRREVKEVLRLEVSHG